MMTVWMSWNLALLRGDGKGVFPMCFKSLVACGRRCVGKCKACAPIVDFPSWCEGNGGADVEG